MTPQRPRRRARWWPSGNLTPLDDARAWRPYYGIAAGRHLGIPFRTREAEDRAVEARRGAAIDREIEFRSYTTRARIDLGAAGRSGAIGKPIAPPITLEFLADIRRFVPGDGWRIARFRFEPLQ